MKILVVSLLRLGDLVLQTAALNSIRKTYPRAEIHLLTNDSNKGITSSLPNVTKVHYFPRKFLQTSLGEIQIPTLWGHNRLKSFIAEVNASDYSLAINLTHNRLSGHLMNLIQASEKQGLVIDNNQRPAFGSRWFRYMNNISTTYSKHKFHLSDVYQWACGAEENEKIQLVATAEGEAEAAEIIKLLSNSNSITVLQTQSSDTKKNWRNESWAQFIQNTIQLHINENVLLIGSPSEKPELEKIKNLVQDSRGQVKIVTPTLAGAYSLLRHARILVSVDTSIKHIGAAARTKVIELCIGSSDLQSTGAYEIGSLIVKSKEGCAPCHHSATCHRSEHFCSASISPELVAGLYNATVNADLAGVSHSADEYQQQAEVYVTSQTQNGFWTIKRFNDESFAVERLIELTAWKHLLTTTNRHDIHSYGSIGFKLFEQLKENSSSVFGLPQLEERLRKEESLILSLKNHFEREFKLCIELGNQNFKGRIASRVAEAEQQLKSGPIFSNLIAEKSEDSFSLARSLISQATDTLDLYQVQNRILRNFDTSGRGPNEYQRNRESAQESHRET